MQCIYKSLTYLIFTYLTLHLYFTYFCLRRLVLYNYFILIHRITMFHFKPFTFAHTSIHTHIAYIWWRSCVVEFFSLICNFSIWLCVFVVFLAGAIALIITNRMLGNARHQQHRYKHTAMRDRNKSALAFSHWETYYYRVGQSQTLCMLLLSLYFYSPYTLHTHVALCMLVF